ncbi:unnamed protein product [Cercospora beticola]|nr:unnamed protein product [Cercospora beticola]
MHYTVTAPAVAHHDADTLQYCTYPSCWSRASAAKAPYSYFVGHATPTGSAATFTRSTVHSIAHGIWTADSPRQAANAISFMFTTFSRLFPSPERRRRTT